LYREQKAEYASYVNGVQQLKSYILEAVGKEIETSMTTEARTVHKLTVPDIVTLLVKTYGESNIREVKKLEAICEAHCPSEEGFTIYIRSVSKAMGELDKVRAGYSEVKKMEMLSENTAHLANIRGIWDRYVAENPRLADRTFDAAVVKITAELPNYITLSSSTSASAVSTAGPKESSSEIKELIAPLTSVLLLAKTTPGRNPKTSTQTPGATKVGKYCFFHGTNYSHTGQECKVMLDPTAGYTAPQKNATAPAIIDGEQGKA
jgi:hypothetical protein